MQKILLLEDDAALGKAIVGTSGSGKSTLLHMLGGLDRLAAKHSVVERLREAES